MTDQSATSDSSRDTVFDVDIEKLARVYARAGLDAAGNEAEGLIDELKAIVTEVLDKFPQLEQMFGSALVSQDEKLGMLDRVFGGRLSTTALNFLKVLAKHDRLGIMRHVVRSTNLLWEERSGRVEVQVQSACELDDTLMQELRNTLSKVLDCDPIISTEVDPELIGGFVVRMGDKVFDASTRTNLERARQDMVARAVEAIQNQPGQFTDQN